MPTSRMLLTAHVFLVLVLQLSSFTQSDVTLAQTSHNPPCEKTIFSTYFSISMIEAPQIALRLKGGVDPESSNANRGESDESDDFDEDTEDDEDAREEMHALKRESAYNLQWEEDSDDCTNIGSVDDPFSLAYVSAQKEDDADVDFLMELCEEHLQKNPENIMLMIQCAVMEHQRGRQDRCVEFLKRAEKVDPMHWWLQQNSHRYLHPESGDKSLHPVKLPPAPPCRDEVTDAEEEEFKEYLANDVFKWKERGGFEELICYQAKEDLPPELQEVQHKLMSEANARMEQSLLEKYPQADKKPFNPMKTIEDPLPECIQRIQETESVNWWHLMQHYRVRSGEVKVRLPGDSEDEDNERPTQVPNPASVHGRNAQGPHTHQPPLFTASVGHTSGTQSGLQAQTGNAGVLPHTAQQAPVPQPGFEHSSIPQGGFQTGMMGQSQQSQFFADHNRPPGQYSAFAACQTQQNTQDQDHDEDM